ncbi:hypothetical protein [Bradyrhizobium sp.]|uniref:hypothetical protein n=1 Tax=Bradyrhizobium sp. TaxID=376 RepID=UPI002734B35D|nr:hypothetical protein [Bradyrhizobium sp.]MDP3075105.1 hypothetical protein [Bradyrhizobium sp.]
MPVGFAESFRDETDFKSRRASSVVKIGDFYPGLTFWARGLDAHFSASVSMGSTLSHFRHRSAVRPFASVIAINRLEHFRHRPSSIVASRFPDNNLDRMRVPAFNMRFPKYSYVRHGALEQTGFPGVSHRSSRGQNYWACRIPPCGGPFFWLLAGRSLTRDSDSPASGD